MKMGEAKGQVNTNYGHIENLPLKAEQKMCIMESFRWMEDLDFSKSLDVGKNKIRIRGVALTNNVESLNKHRYLTEELKRSARTLVGCPILCNHDINRKIGTVEWAEYEDPNLEYYGVISREPYVTMLREHSTEINGVSIGAKFLFLECARCHKKFDDEKQWRKHMTEVEFLNVTDIPHGIIYQELSLVLAPEQKGVATATVQVMETAGKGLNELFETVITERSEGGFWTFETDNPNSCNRCSYYEGVSVFRGDSLKTLFPDHTMIDEDTIRVNLHPNCECKLRRGQEKVGEKTEKKRVEPAIVEIPTLTERVEKRGDQFCVVHCSGPDESKVIKCFPTEAEAQAMHQAIQANETVQEAHAHAQNFHDLMGYAPEPYRSAWLRAKEPFKTICEEWLKRKDEIEGFDFQKCGMKETKQKLTELADRNVVLETQQRAMSAEIVRRDNLVAENADLKVANEKLERENGWLEDWKAQHPLFKGRFKALETRQSPCVTDPMKEK